MQANQGTNETTEAPSEPTLWKRNEMTQQIEETSQQVISYSNLFTVVMN